MNPTSRATRTAFTLAELLIVIAIIAIVIALVVPALGLSRDSARAAATKTQLAKITAAAGVFSNDYNRMPGYFSAREMGRQENISRGMSGAENMLLDLMGFQTGTLQVGPTLANTVGVDPQRLGVPGPDGKQYYVPDPKVYVPQIAPSSQIGAAPHTDVEGAPQLPDLVDSWGAPILVWTADETHIAKPTASSFKFAAMNSGTANSPPPAKYYWASNAAFLTATQLGKRKLDQTDTVSGSTLGVNQVATETSLTAVLGSPNAPYRDPQNLTAVPVNPLSGRAPLIVQSAGRDGYYLGRKDKGAKQFPPAGPMTYGTNFAPNITQPLGTGNQYIDKNGKATNIDILADFDDIFAYGGT